MYIPYRCTPLHPTSSPLPRAEGSIVRPTAAEPGNASTVVTSVRHGSIRKMPDTLSPDRLTVFREMEESRKQTMVGRAGRRHPSAWIFLGHGTWWNGFSGTIKFCSQFCRTVSFGHGHRSKPHGNAHFQSYPVSRPWRRAIELTRLG